MKITATAIPDVLIVEPSVFGDDRGFFFESFNLHEWNKKTGLNTIFVQDNHSRSSKNVLRGLHYQINQPQGKLVRVISGEVFDVAVDLRQDSSTFGQWVGVRLSSDNKRQVWIPKGFAHGFLVVSDTAEVLYKTTDYWSPGDERAIVWNDSSLKISWPLQGAEPIVSAKDAAACQFMHAEKFDNAKMP